MSNFCPNILTSLLYVSSSRLWFVLCPETEQMSFEFIEVCYWTWDRERANLYEKWEGWREGNKCLGKKEFKTFPFLSQLRRRPSLPSLPLPPLHTLNKRPTPILLLPLQSNTLLPLTLPLTPPLILPLSLPLGRWRRRLLRVLCVRCVKWWPYHVRIVCVCVCERERVWVCVCGIKLIFS